MEIRTLFFSDVHLGSKHAKASELLEFLKKIHGIPEKIYIIGDFIDGWKIKSNWCWNDKCNLVIRKLLSFVKKGSQIYYVAGNHDEFLRCFLQDFDDLSFGSIHLSDEFIHETADNRKLLIVHGDKFDVSIKYARWLCFLGDIGYELLLGVNTLVDWIRKSFGVRKYWSLSKSVKQQVKKAVNYVGDFEIFLMRYCREKECEGVVCGHIHTANIKQMGSYTYYNTGDWVESMTSIVEYSDGRIELIQHTDQ